MNRKNVVAASSGGGHWEQLMLLRGALDDHDTFYVVTDRDLAVRARVERYETIADCNRNKILTAVKSLLSALRIVVARHPDVVVSTGALPGLFCLVGGKLVGAKTIWIDSVANAERISGCGRVARLFATQCLTQWDHLEDGKFKYVGSVL